MRPFRLSILLLYVQLMLATAANAQPASQFATLEKSLLDADASSLDFQVTASGSIEASISGSLSKSPAGDIALRASGVFAGQDVDLIALQNGSQFQYGTRTAPVATKSPDALWESLVIGFTRMGILHNIANLSAGAQPDHADGGVSDWVLASSVVKNGRSFTFDIIVNGNPAGSATLTVDELGNPTLRQQTVAFPGGEMRVVETYSYNVGNEQGSK